MPCAAFSAGTRMQIAAITLVVPEYDVAIAFYTRVLGFTLLTDLDQGGGKRWVTVAPPNLGGEGSATGCALVLARAADDAQRAAIGTQTGGRVGFFLRVEDFEATRARMEAASVHFEEATRVEPYGKVAVFQDPFGNRWDLLGPATS